MKTIIYSILSILFISMLVACGSQSSTEDTVEIDAGLNEEEVTEEEITEEVVNEVEAENESDEIDKGFLSMTEEKLLDIARYLCDKYDDTWLAQTVEEYESVYSEIYVDRSYYESFLENFDPEDTKDNASTTYDNESIEVLHEKAFNYHFDFVTITELEDGSTEVIDEGEGFIMEVIETEDGQYKVTYLYSVGH